MNDGNTHWYLCVIDMMEKEARLYDTLPRSRLNQKRLNDVKQMVIRLQICYSFNVFSSNYFLPYICLCFVCNRWLIYPTCSKTLPSHHWLASQCVGWMSAKWLFRKEYLYKRMGMIQYHFCILLCDSYCTFYINYLFHF